VLDLASNEGGGGGEEEKDGHMFDRAMGDKGLERFIEEEGGQASFHT